MMVEDSVWCYSLALTLPFPLEVVQTVLEGLVDRERTEKVLRTCAQMGVSPLDVLEVVTVDKGCVTRDADGERVSDVPKVEREPGWRERQAVRERVNRSREAIEWGGRDIPS